MNVGATFEANSETAEMMQPGVSTFDDPTDFSKATTVRVAAPRNDGWDVAFVKDASAFVVVVTAVGVDAARTAQRSSTHAADRCDCLDQRNQLGDVVTIGAGQDCRDWRSVGVGGDVVFRSRSRSIGGVRASFRPPQPHESKRNRRRLGRSRSSRPLAVSLAAMRAVDSTRRLAANRVACASS